MQIRRGVAVSSIAAAVLLTPAISASGSTASAATVSCRSWYVLGLHGMNEGPSTKGHWKRSTELSRFQADLAKDGKGGNGLRAVEKDVRYLTVAANLKHPKATIKALVASVRRGVAALQARWKHYTHTCPGSLISVFGYSEGAWIINIWQRKYSHEAIYGTYSAALIGDPCYGDIAGNAGLARLFTATCGPLVGYIDPEIAPTNSDCLKSDPVCGVPYEGNADGRAAQIAAAIACTKLKKCRHYRYVPHGEVARLASWMLEAT